jgi:hypothetical protein
MLSLLGQLYYWAYPHIIKLGLFQSSRVMYLIWKDLLLTGPLSLFQIIMFLKLK